MNRENVNITFLHSSTNSPFPNRGNLYQNRERSTATHPYLPHNTESFAESEPYVATTSLPQNAPHLKNLGNLFYETRPAAL